jgi:hypothetical protein
MSLHRLGGSSRAWLAAGAAAACIIPGAAACAEKKKDDLGSYFDPEALERGAKALREINSSPYGKQVGSPLNTTYRNRCGCRSYWVAGMHMQICPTACAVATDSPLCFPFCPLRF